MKKQKMGIYLITNIKTKRVYVGSALNVTNRRAEHFRDLRNRNHDNSYLQNSYNKHGQENFTFQVLWDVFKEEFLCCYEQSLLNYYRTLSGGVYNCPGPVERPNLGIKRSTAFCKAQSERSLARNFHHSEETIQIMSNLKMGYKWSAEQRIKHSKVRKGMRHRPHTQETKDKVRVAKLGQKASDETKAKLSKVHMGRISPNRGKLLSEEIKNKISISIKGKVLSQETKYKIKIGNLGKRLKRPRNGPVESIEPITGLVQEFASIKEAANFYKIAAYSIRLCANGKRYTANSFYWQYI